jgi:hypothetical protein
VIGPDSEAETVQGVITLAMAVDARIAKTGERPELASLLLREPLAFSHPKYVRGSLGVRYSTFALTVLVLITGSDSMSGSWGICCTPGIC